MPLYEYQCDACAHRFEVIQKYSDRADRGLPEVRRPGEEAVLVAGDSVQGHRLLHHRLRRGGKSDIGRESAKAAKRIVRAQAAKPRSETKTETKTETEDRVEADVKPAD